MYRIQRILIVFPLEKASEAHELLEEKNTVGKLLLKVGGGLDRLSTPC